MTGHFFELFRRVDHFRRSCVKSYWEQCGKSDPIALLTPRLRIHLFAVMLCEPCSLQEFMNHTGLSAPAASAAIEKLEKEFNGEGRVLIRPSGTEPKVRVMIEGKDKKRIDEEAHKLAELIQNLMI